MPCAIETTGYYNSKVLLKVSGKDHISMDRDNSRYIFGEDNKLLDSQTLRI